MDKYLLEILKDVNTIIIPDLGALTITNTDTGEIMFMPFLKHDDGKLSAYIAEKEGMDENEAKNVIAKYVREINTKLDQGDSYDMFEFGTFSKNADGDVEFNNWDGSKKKAAPAPKAEPEATKAEPEKEEVKEAPKEEKKEEKKPAAKKTTKAAPKKEAEAKPKEKKTATKKATEKKTVAKKTEPKKETPKKEAKPAPKKEEPTKPVKAEAKKEAPVKAAAPVKSKAEMNVAEKEELAKNEAKLLKLKKESEKEEKKKRSAGFYILITLVVLIAAGGTYVGFNYDEVKQHIPFLADNDDSGADKTEMDKMKETLGLTDDEEETSDESEDEQVDSQESDEIEEIEETEVEPEIEEPAPEPEPVPEKKPAPAANNSGNPYHIVAGAFSSADNAERLAQSLRDQGYPSTTFLRGSMTIVSVSAHATNADAAAALQNAKADVPKGWILYWK
jgi:cytoskeletal protein RodZ